MYFTTVLETSHPTALEAPATPAQSGISSSDYAYTLRFEGGVRGSFGLHLAENTARTLAANFLGEDDSTLTPQEISEVVGELTNMLCGSVVSRIEGRSKFALSHPESILALPALTTADSLISLLHTDEGVITTWVIVDETRGEA
jgi:CheY-specific phosphatase CheX